MFSVIMPVWNRSRLVTKAVESVLAQTFGDWELVIVDDGSDDDLDGRLAPYFCDRVKLLRTSHRGVSAARNVGLRNSTGPLVAYLDSDNTWRPRFLERMAAALDNPGNRSAAAYCKCAVHRRDSSDRVYLAGVGGQDFDFARILDTNYIDLNTFVHRRECVEHAGGHDETIRRLADWDFILRVVSKYPPIFVPEVLVDYYLLCHDDSITRREDARPASRMIRRENLTNEGPLRVRHDTIEYVWRRVSDEKRYNWARVRSKGLDTSTYTAWGFPYMLQIEPTNSCNLRCPLCPTGRGDLTRPPRHMALEAFTALVDDMERYLLLAILWDWGEPLMNPHLPEMIRYAAERDIKTVTSTNGHFFRDESHMAALLESGLTTLIVAIDSVSAETYETYRRDGTLTDVRAGVETLLTLKRKLSSPTRIVIRAVATRHNEHELAATREYARRVGADDFVVKTLNPACGSTSLDSELVPDNPRYQRLAYHRGTRERIPSEEPCLRVWRMSNVLSNGDVVPCCYDFCGDLKVGNVQERPFTEIWASPEYAALRKRVLTERNAILQCRQCVDSFRLSPTGMFAESRRFTRAGDERLVDLVRDRLFSPGVLRVVRRAGRKLGLAI